MASPFPGMDPFLEEPTGWSGVHIRLMNSISDYLAARISPHFFVEIEQRTYSIIMPEDYDSQLRERYIEIRDTRSREVVTTLEVLSPFNKAPGTSGRQDFLHKRERVMTSKVHWLEIDLLRAGERLPEVNGKSDYYALLKRGETPGPFEVWYFDLRDKLPTIAAPLRSPFADVPLDLQAVFDDVYTRAHYADSLDYSRPVPLPRLRPADAAWVEGQVQAWLAARQGGG